MISKRVLDAGRVRRVPASFGWVDHRLVRQGHIGRCGPEAWALYLLLVTVADAEGLSYYSDQKATGLLGLEPSVFSSARQQLVRAGLVAWEAPLYQVLDLASGGAPLAELSGRRMCAQGPRSVGELLGGLLAQGGGAPCR